MLRQVADGVLIHVSNWCESNAVVVRGADGVLLVDPGIHGDELVCLANDIAGVGQTVAAGFSTHPHWDHLLWHPSFGSAPRYATEHAATSARERLAGGIDARRFGIPEDVPLDLLGGTIGVPADATEIPWEGPRVRMLEHRAHAPGHAALLIEDRGVLVAGDMLSDVFIPMLDLMGSADPIGDYLAALRLLESVEVDLIIPGHGSIGDADELHKRIEQDRAYVEALRDGRDPGDPRVTSAKPGWEFVADVYARQLQALAQRT